MEVPFIVTLGASAGGIRALEAFFQNLPSDTGHAYVVILHLSPDHPSYLHEVMGRMTAMRVTPVTLAMPVAANQVYVIAPQTEILYQDGKLIPRAREQNALLRYPIDGFLESLAEERGDRAICAIFSGSGSDGTRGAQKIKAHGGLVLVQNPEEAEFSGMCDKVIGHAQPDQILSAAAMPHAIATYTQSWSREVEAWLQDESAQVIHEVLKYLSEATGADFRGYRLSTIARRLARRIALRHCDSLVDYFDLIKHDEGERQNAIQEFLIGVTQFFRDREAFRLLEEQVAPAILAQLKPLEGVRIWSVGCSTGQEAYSLAMCFAEAMERSQCWRPLKIFASDLDQEALHRGHLGCYPLSIAADLDPRYLSKYFSQKEDGYEVQAKIRNQVVFTHHNCISSPPFTQLHLVSCRNLLIYFEAELQEKALSLFHFGLLPKGYLFLGRSESLGALSPEFAALKPGFNLFQKKRDGKLANLENVRFQHQKANRPPHQEGKKTLIANGMARGEESLPLLQPLFDNLIREFVPPGFLIDGKMRLIHVFHDAGKYLQIPAGQPDFNVLQMVSKEVRLALKEGIEKVRETGEAFSLTQVRHQDLQLGITVRPLSLGGREMNYFMVFFAPEEGPVSAVKASETKAYDSLKAHQHEVSELSKALSATKDSLRRKVEELKAANEELQSTNEQLRSANEELQSSNEELESVNEELHTVSQQYDAKIHELSEAYQDLDHLVEQAHMGVLILGSTLKIRRFNKEITSLIGLMGHDLNRSIFDISFKRDHAKIVSAIESCWSHGRPLSLRVPLEKGPLLVRMSTIDHPSPKPSKKRLGLILTTMNLAEIESIHSQKGVFEPED